MGKLKVSEYRHKYLATDLSNGAVGLFSELELVLLSLYQDHQIPAMQRLLASLGVSTEQSNEVIDGFLQRLERDGWSRAGFSDIMPQPLSSVYLNVTTACNYRCRYCYQGDHVAPARSGEVMSLEHARSIIEAVKSINADCRVIVSGGEPLLHPGILGICSLLEESSMSFSVLTNGSCLSDGIAAGLANFDLLKNVQISLDGMSDKVNRLTRGETYESTMRGISCAVRHKLPFSLAPTIHDGNLDDIVEIALFSARSGGGFTPNNLRRHPQAPVDDLRLSDQYLLSAIKDAEEAILREFGQDFLIANKLRTFINGDIAHGHFLCSAGYSLLDIDWNGDIYPCHLLRSELFLLGNVLHDGFDAAFEMAVRLGIRTMSHEIEKCRSCHVLARCGAGCKAAAFHAFGEFRREDPLCSVLYQNELNRLDSEYDKRSQ